MLDYLIHELVLLYTSTTVSFENVEKQSVYGASSLDRLSIVMHAEGNAMNEKSGRRQPKSFVNKVDPAFDPITAALRQMHDGVASEAIPDEFLRLLDEIDDRIAAKKKLS